MLLKTDRFGEIRIAQEDVIHFPDGLLGFEELHRYVVVERERKGPIRFLQAVDDGRIAFAVTDPQTFRPDYLPELGEEDRAALQYESDEDLAVLVILTVPQEVREMTANLMAPVIINVKERIGRQVVQGLGEYSTRHRIVDEMERSRRLIRAAGAHRLRTVSLEPTEDTLRQTV